MLIDLDYTFEVQVGPSYYSAQTDERFCDTENVEWQYSITYEEAAKAMVNMVAQKENTLEQNIQLAIENATTKQQLEDILKELEVETLPQALEKAKKEVPRSPLYKELNEYSYLDYILGDLDDYINKDELEEYFLDAAYDDFQRNN